MPSNSFQFGRLSVVVALTISTWCCNQTVNATEHDIIEAHLTFAQSLSKHVNAQQVVQRQQLESLVRLQAEGHASTAEIESAQLVLSQLALRGAACAQFVEFLDEQQSLAAESGQPVAKSAIVDLSILTETRLDSPTLTTLPLDKHSKQLVKDYNASTDAQVNSEVAALQVRIDHLEELRSRTLQLANPHPADEAKAEDLQNQINVLMAEAEVARTAPRAIILDSRMELVQDVTKRWQQIIVESKANQLALTVATHRKQRDRLAALDQAGLALSGELRSATGKLLQVEAAHRKISHAVSKQTLATTQPTTGVGVASVNRDGLRRLRNEQQDTVDSETAEAQRLKLAMQKVNRIAVEDRFYRGEGQRLQELLVRQRSRIHLANETLSRTEAWLTAYNEDVIHTSNTENGTDGSTSRNRLLRITASLSADAEVENAEAELNFNRTRCNAFKQLHKEGIASWQDAAGAAAELRMWEAKLSAAKNAQDRCLAARQIVERLPQDGGKQIASTQL